MKQTLPPRPPNPCRKDCPDRSGTCHGTCEKYKTFHDWNLRYYDTTLKESQSSGASHRQSVRDTERTRRKWQGHNYKYKN